MRDWTKQIAVIVAALGLMAGSAWQAKADLVMTQFSADYANFNGFSVDPVTGDYYSHSGYGYGVFGDSQKISEYNNLSDFKNNVAGGSVVLGGNGDWGTYFTVNDGELFARTSDSTSNWPTGTQSAKWNAATGTLDASISSMPGMGGANGSDTFDWGGFSGVNWMQDSTGLYVLGKNEPGTGWQIDKMDQNLGILGTTNFNAGPLGYAFMINGILFASSHFQSNVIDLEVNTLTGVASNVNITLDGMGSLYADNAFYDQTSDKLFIHNANDGSLFTLDGAASQFGADTLATPEPSTIVSAGTACLMALGCAWRRHRRAKLAIA
jgi:autoaggregation protein RapA/B/C